MAGADERRDGIQQLDLHGAIVARHNRKPLGYRVVLAESAGAQVGAARLSSASRRTLIVLPGGAACTTRFCSSTTRGSATGQK